MNAVVWTIAGSDSGGGAGIQADLHTFQDFKVRGCSVITAITAQNSVGVSEVALTEPQMVRAQLNALKADLPASAIKLGMLGDIAVMEVITEFLHIYEGFVVCDPVMISTTGARLMSPEAEQYLRDVIFPKVDLVTPNAHEAAAILERDLSDDWVEDAKALSEICRGGAVLLKGGHGGGIAFCEDIFVRGRTVLKLRGERVRHEHTHGSGCTLSAAVTALVARGYTVENALVLAKQYVTQGIRAASSWGEGPGPVAHLGWQQDAADYPKVPIQPITGVFFPPLDTISSKLYPIVDRADWVNDLGKLGVERVQLRIKDLPEYALEKEIMRAIDWARHHNMQLFINDYWELALEHEAYGIHLGQEDLEALSKADIEAMLEAGVRLGVSTHDELELAQALSLHPSYVALGPIFQTYSKPMYCDPHGVERLREWVQRTTLPVVAIGGIGLENFEAVCETGVESVAMISAITQADDVVESVRYFLRASGKRMAGLTAANDLDGYAP